MGEEAEEMGTRREAEGAKRGAGGKVEGGNASSAETVKWWPVGVDVCPYGQAIQDRKIRGRIGCKLAV